MDLTWIGKVITTLFFAIGHGAGWVAAFNRINATAIHRDAIKVIEKCFILFCFAIPASFLAEHRLTLFAWYHHADWSIPNLGWLWNGYLGLCGIAFILLVPEWIANRLPLLRPSSYIVQSTSREWDLRKVLPTPILQSPSARWLASLEFNEVGMLEVNEKHLYHPTVPSAWHHLRIGHISDVHLTGKLSIDYQRFAMERLAELRPDILFIAGDIVDFHHQVKNLRAVLGPLHARLGKYFVLGNHDRRLANPDEIRDELAKLGWTDLGRGSVHLWEGNKSLRLWGNERPWFPLAQPQTNLLDERFSEDASEFRIAVSHSPDQWRWAQKLDAHWFLAGHTHGGQVRVPGLGPLVAPSWYGTKYASGVFMEEPVLMHVSRGLSGVHMLRWRCKPEVSLLVPSTAQPIPIDEKQWAPAAWDAATG